MERKEILGLLEKVIEFGHGCRFMDSKHPEFDKEVIAETEKRKKREERKKNVEFVIINPS